MAFDTTDRRACVKCAHHILEKYGRHLCANPNFFPPQYDPVTGERIGSVRLSCYVLRDTTGLCKPHAIRFVAAEVSNVPPPSEDRW